VSFIVQKFLVNCYYSYTNAADFTETIAAEHALSTNGTTQEMEHSRRMHSAAAYTVSATELKGSLQSLHAAHYAYDCNFIILCNFVIFTVSRRILSYFSTLFTITI